MKKSSDHLLRMLELGTSLTTEKNPNKLLEMILTESRAITNCDAGTLYIKDGETLKFKIIENETLDIFQGTNGEDIDLPPLEITSKSVSAYVARNKEVLNISDVYKEESELLEGSKKYDKITGYHTQSMLVLPLMDYEDNLIGVMQLINARNHDGDIVPFLKYHEKMILYHGSQVAIYMSNMNYLEEIHNLFSSFVRMMVGAIDRKARYNANHTKNIVKYLDKFIDYINRVHKGPLAKKHFDDKRKYELIMAAWLHDIGKINIPLKIMDKPTRLGDNFENLLNKINLEKKEVELMMLKQQMSEDEALSRIKFLENALELVAKYNDPSNFMIESALEKVEYLKEYKAIGGYKELLTQEEYLQLMIRKGSLTAEEKGIMNSHALITREMLEEIPFTEDLKHVKDWASMHHEKLNGKGYPAGLSAEEIPFEARVLSIIDVFEALTSRDRPYKKPMPVEKAFEIIGFMVKDGDLDGEIVEEFKKSKAWEGVL